MARKFFDVVKDLVLPLEKRTRMYAHPSTLERLLDIRANDRLTEEVTTLIVLGKAVSSGSPYDTGVFHNLRDKPWPQFASASDPNVPRSLIEMVRAEATPFHKTYAPLVSALSKLPRLQTIMYAPSAEHEGLNRVSQANIDAWAVAHADHSASYGRVGQPSVSHAQRKVQWSDGEVLMGLLIGLSRVSVVDVRHKLKSFRKESIRYHWLVPTGPAARARDKTIAPLILAAVSRNLTSLDFAATSKGGSDDGNDLATNILRISAWPSSLYTGAKQDNGLEIDPLSSFLLHHRKTLKSIELVNVVMCDFRGKSVKSDMKKALLYLGEKLPQLETAVIRLSKATCCGWCGDYIGKPEAGQCCRTLLNDYWFSPTAMLHLSSVKELAADLEVSEQSRSWDFGEYVMRRVKEVRKLV
ncbi:hypothetical protein LTR85_012112 [Meristemomyces frigidus]|nr:hypothetical protein LTR85_012112 [Meristemomyces frigidus]